MSADEPDFGDCPAGQEVEAFHARIFDGLLDASQELEERRREIRALSADARGEDEAEFLALDERVQAGLAQLQDAEMAYDKKYELAQTVRAQLMEMELL